ncbi:GNAT family N-acetyltransferase [Microbacterium sp. NPDC016588]
MSGPALRTRPPGSGDVELFMRLQRVCFPWAVEPASDQAAANLFSAIGQGRAGRFGAFAVAEVGSQFAGYASARPFAPWVDGTEIYSADTPVAVVTQVAVPPKFRRQGVGRALLASLEGQLAALEYSLAIAHIQPHHAAWYQAAGWTALPPGCGLAWIEPPSPANARLLPPGAPPDVLATHTPFLHETPLNSNGYTTLAFKITGARMRVIAAAFYRVSSERAENGQLAAAALIKALDSDPAALAQIPRASAVILQASAMEPAAAAAWLSGLGKGGGSG